MSKQVVYALQFRGKAAPTNEAGTVMKAKTAAAACTITTSLGANGVGATLRPEGDPKVTFESEVRIAGQGTFDEDGTISFGDGSRINFSTVGVGILGPSADPKLNTGAVIWKVDSGEGRFAGATGFITSNFSVSDEGEVVDNHFGVLFVK